MPRKLRPVARIVGWLGVVLFLALFAADVAPQALYYFDAYPGTTNTPIAHPCQVLTGHLVSTLLPGTRPIKVGLGCGWYAPGTSYRQHDAAVVDFEPSPPVGPLLPFQTPDQRAHQSYASSVSFRGWRPVAGLGDEGSELQPDTTFTVRSGNVVWTLYGSQRVPQATMLAVARAIAHSLAKQSGLT